MSFLHGLAYHKDHVFSTEDLSLLPPRNIYWWMTFKAYGTDDPSPDDFPTEGWSSSFKYYKKAISYFMPNCQLQWNELLHVGNVNDLISVVMKKKIRKQRKPSQADRAFEKPEFEQVMAIFETFPDFDPKRCYPAMEKFQFHIIARLDDTCQVKRDVVMPCFQFPFALIV
eukprot:2572868-Ditylum_brightwellii.AAC.1